MRHMKPAHGRPTRTDNPKKTTLYLAEEKKRALFKMASESNLSMSRVVEILIDLQLEGAK